MFFVSDALQLESVATRVRTTNFCSISKSDGVYVTASASSPPVSTGAKTPLVDVDH